MAGVEFRKMGEIEGLCQGKPVLALPTEWTDQGFRAAFEAFKIPSEMFHPREHIRLAWIYSCHFPQEEALVRMVQGIQAFAKHHGAAAKYHHTITVTSRKPRSPEQTSPLPPLLKNVSNISLHSQRITARRPRTT